MKKRVLVNFISNNSGGTIVFKDVVIREFTNSPDIDFVIVVDNVDRYQSYGADNIEFVDTSAFFRSRIGLLFFYGFIGGLLARKYSIDVILNFGDIVIRTAIRQVFYFDWPYAVYPENESWERMAFRDLVTRRIKMFLFQISLRYARTVIVQSKVIEDRFLTAFPGIETCVVEMGFDPEIVKPALRRVKGQESPRKRLIYPTKYYPHKNLEILIPVAKLVREQNLDIRIDVTFSTLDNPRAKKLANGIYDEGLDRIINMLGHLERETFIDRFTGSDGLLMPTFFESYGIPYIEALSAEIPVFTSDRDFARVTCGDCAFYFDPNDPVDILRALKEGLYDRDELTKKIHKTRILLRSKISWAECVRRICETL